MVLQSSDVNRNIPEGDSIGHAIDIRFVGGHSFPDAFVLRVSAANPLLLESGGVHSDPKGLVCAPGLHPLGCRV